MRRRHERYEWIVIVAVLSGCAKSAGDPPPRASEAMTEEQQMLYALGAALANNLRELELSVEDKRLVLEGFEDAVSDVPARVDVASFIPRIQGLRERRLTAAIVTRREEGDKFLAQASTQPGAVKTPSGLVIRDLTVGAGRQPAEHDIVTVHYEGSLPGGRVVDSSLKRGKPIEFRVNGVISCWKEALMMMRVGGKSRVVCPPDLAYGDGGSPPVIPPGATLTFDIELLDVAKPDDARGS